MEFNGSNDPIYPVNNQQNTDIYNKYKALSMQEHNVIFGGRLAEYKYYDMDKVIEKALSDGKREFKQQN